MKALFLILHRKDRSPGQRYRHEQYVSHLEANGIQCSFSPLLVSEKEDQIFYSKAVFLKILIGLKALMRRYISIKNANKFDAVYIYRDAFFFGTFFEKWLRKKNVNIIYDFDDAIWLDDENPNQGIFNRLKNPNKVAIICSIADRVIVGNQYLRNFAKAYNEETSIIPSTIDFQKYVKNSNPHDSICIGWTGSFSTLKHFETVIPALEVINQKFENKVYFKIIGDLKFSHPSMNVKCVRWQSETEAHDLSEIDIGLMPLPDNEWTRGKCAMKGLQYMALEIPTIMSPVGVNSDIINDGENGFLAGTIEEWVEKISLLVEDKELRNKVGKAGKLTVVKEYSVEANKDKWLRAFQF